MIEDMIKKTSYPIAQRLFAMRRYDNYIFYNLYNLLCYITKSDHLLTSLNLILYLLLTFIFILDCV